MRVTFPVTVHVFFIRDDMVLMLRRYNTGYEDGNYSVVAGHLDGDESIIEAAIREAWEEIGVQILPEHLKVVGVMHRKEEDERVDFFLVASSWSGDPVNREQDKCDEITWYSLGELPVNTIPYVRRALDNYQHKIWFDEFGWL